MNDSDKLYALIFTHALGYPYFDHLLYADFQGHTLSYKGHFKKYLFKLSNIVQSEATLKLIVIAISVNILYERYLNFRTTPFPSF